MSFTYTLGLNWVCPSGTVSKNLTATGAETIEFDAVIEPAASDYEIDVAVPVAPDLQAFFLVATAAMTVKTNATGGGAQETITLAANVPYFWITGNGSIPLLGAITKFYVSSTPGGTLTFRALFNTVP